MESPSPNSTPPPHDCCSKPVPPPEVVASAPSAHACCHAATDTAPAPAMAHDHAGAGAGLYVCPMCPGVSSPVPAACPKCGMALERALPLHGDEPDPELTDMRRRLGWSI